MIRKIALATGREWAQLDFEERLLAKALTARNIAAEAAVWDDPQIDWSAYDGVIVRSCWDYTERLAEFLSWIARLEASGVPLWNPPDVIRRNVDKRYLRTLEEAAIDIVPTGWIEEKSGSTLTDILVSSGWDEVVIKPVVSAGAKNTWRVRQKDAAEHQGRVDELLAAGHALMIQPFLPEIVAQGEWSLLFFSGQYSHAVVKRAAAGDFRVQEQYGGIAALTEPPEWILRQAEMALQLTAGDFLYARVDGVLRGDRFLIMEMELTEPRLFLNQDPDAASRLADAVAKALGVA